MRKHRTPHLWPRRTAFRTNIACNDSLCGRMMHIGVERHKGEGIRFGFRMFRGQDPYGCVHFTELSCACLRDGQARHGGGVDAYGRIRHVRHRSGQDLRGRHPFRSGKLPWRGRLRRLHAGSCRGLAAIPPSRKEMAVGPTGFVLFDVKWVKAGRSVSEKEKMLCHPAACLAPGDRQSSAPPWAGRVARAIRNRERKPR